MISMENVTYCYPGGKENSGIWNVNLHIRQGEFVVIAGRSGCGKTTLAKCMNGLIPHFEEGIFEGNVKLQNQNTRDIRIGKIGEKAGSVFQDPRSQFFTTEVFDEMAFGCRNMGLSREEIYRRIQQTLHTLEIDSLRDRSLLALSSGEKQKIAIACCYCMKPQIFLLDEPSANLDQKAVEELGKMLQKLKEQGHTIVVFEHRFSYLCNQMDRFVVMEAGKIQQIYTKEEAVALSGEQLMSMGLRLLKMQGPMLPDRVTVKGEAALRVENLSFAYRGAESFVFTKRNLQAQEGEIVAITGANGVGKTTFARVLTGLLQEKEGCIWWKGERLDRKKRQKNFYYVLQDSDYQLFAESVEKELLMGFEHQKGKQEEAEKTLCEFGLEPYRTRHPMSLSRGQKQRVTIAAAAMSDARVLILDEPSSGLDGAAMRRLGQILQKMAETGRIIFVISHDEEFVHTCCQRIVEWRHV